MARAGVPTARAEVFHHFDSARQYVESLSPPVVIKADGLAAGKGVVVAETTEQALSALRTQMVDRAFGQAGETVLVEEHLQGPELSVFAFVDGKRLSPLIAAVDYKRVGDGDTGPNTGGMGAYSPPLGVLWNHEVERSARTEIMEPVVAALAAEGCPYVGILYAGLMLTQDGLKVIEFNCRFGDPEAQVILPRIETDLLDLMLATADGNVDDVDLRVSPNPCVGVVVASGGYPDAYKTGFPVAGLENTLDQVTVFHAGTKLNDNEETVTDGGRVLTVSGSGATHKDARLRAYTAAGRTTFDGLLLPRRHRGLRKAVTEKTSTTAGDVPGLLAAFDSSTLLRPRFDVPNIVDLSQAVFDWAGVPNLDIGENAERIGATFADAGQLVFVVVDGLGMNFIDKLEPRLVPPTNTSA